MNGYSLCDTVINSSIGDKGPPARKIPQPPRFTLEHSELQILGEGQNGKERRKIKNIKEDSYGNRQHRDLKTFLKGEEADFITGGKRGHLLERRGMGRKGQ